MNKERLLFYFFLVFLLPVTAQEAEEVSGREPFYINYNFAGHMSYFRPSLRLSFEDKVNDDLSINYELGYINHRLYVFRDSESLIVVPFRKLNGIHVSVEPRWYVYTEAYLSFSVAYHQLEDHRVDDVWRFGNAYIQELDFKRIEKTATIMFHGGARIASSGKLTLGTSFGMGMRYVRLSNDLPIDAEYLPNLFFNSTGNLVDGDHRRFAAQLAVFLTFKN